jgi:hypothetical protein
MELKKLEVSQAELDGKWFDYPESDLRVKLASVHSPRYQKALRRKFGSARAEIGGGVIDEDREDELTNEAIAETILLGWENLTENGKPVEYSPEAAVKILNRAPRLYSFVMRTATREGQFVAATDEAQVENLGKG